MYSTNHARSSPLSNRLSPDTKMFSSGCPNAHELHSAGYGGVHHESQYVLQDISSLPMANNEPAPPSRSPNPTRTLPSTLSHSKSPLKAKDSRRRSTGPSKSEERSDGSGAVRRRISRACDQCNQLRTKCDGGTPCSHCVGGLLSMWFAKNVANSSRRVWTYL